MFSRLFSRKQSKDSVSDALEQLRNTENILLKKQAFLEAKAMAQFELARDYGTKKKKEGMEALRAKKKYEAELQRVNGTIITIQNQISNLEDAFVNAEMLKAMGNASKALKTTYDGMDADAVHDLVDEIDEQREMVDEIATALSTQYGASVVVDEDDLLAELNSLEKEDESCDEQSSKEPEKIVDPTYQFSKLKIKSGEDRDLSQLQAWANS